MPVSSGNVISETLDYNVFLEGCITTSFPLGTGRMHLLRFAAQTEFKFAKTICFFFTEIRNRPKYYTTALFHTTDPNLQWKWTGGNNVLWIRLVPCSGCRKLSNTQIFLCNQVCGTWEMECKNYLINMDLHAFLPWYFQTKVVLFQFRFYQLIVRSIQKKQYCIF